jgi:hypothetical protein
MQLTATYTKEKLHQHIVGQEQTEQYEFDNSNYSEACHFIDTYVTPVTGELEDEVLIYHSDDIGTFTALLHDELTEEDFDKDKQIIISIESGDWTHIYTLELEELQ